MLNEDGAEHLRSSEYISGLYDVLALAVTNFDVNEEMPEAKINYCMEYSKDDIKILWTLQILVLTFRVVCYG